ncbi:MAG: DUF503 domain-containing protein [Bryobacterales bacterium]|jgi:hypothetical protein|nr:DUF503 domain-containing protein [Bryobacterales bacterium]
MVSIGVLTLEIRIEHAQSLKDKRQVVKSLKDRLRHHLNVAVAETEFQQLWQLSELVVVTVASSRQVAEGTLRRAEEMAERHLAGGLISTHLEWLH